MAARARTTNRARWIPRLRAIGSSYWFVPSVMAAAAMGLAYLTLWLDHRLGRGALPWTYGGDAAGARAVLSTIGSSMITVAGVVFSITIVALSLASQQFGPMLLRNFMKDRPNQLVLGTFVATYLFCLMVMREAVERDPVGFVPHLSVTVAIGLAVLSLGVLIFFIHHIAQSIRVETLLVRVGRQLERAVGRMYPSAIGHDGDDDEPLDAEAACRTIAAPADGYLDEIGHHELMRAASEHDLVVEVLARPHDFVVRGTPVLRVRPTEGCSDETAASLADTLIVGAGRAPRDDLRHGIDQLVQLCLRALSPSLNDPVTAKATMDRMFAFLAGVARRGVPAAHRHDDDGRLRIVVTRPSFDELLGACLDPVRRNAGRQADVFEHLIAGCARLAESTDGLACRRALRALATRIEHSARSDLAPTDHPAVEAGLRRLERILERGPEPEPSASERRGSGVRRGERV